MICYQVASSTKSQPWLSAAEPLRQHAVSGGEARVGQVSPSRMRAWSSSRRAASARLSEARARRRDRSGSGSRVARVELEHARVEPVELLVLAQQLSSRMSISPRRRPGRPRCRSGGLDSRTSLTSSRGSAKQGDSLAISPSGSLSPSGFLLVGGIRDLRQVGGPGHRADGLSRISGSWASRTRRSHRSAAGPRRPWRDSLELAGSTAAAWNPRRCRVDRILTGFHATDIGLEADRVSLAWCGSARAEQHLLLLHVLVQAFLEHGAEIVPEGRVAVVAAFFSISPSTRLTRFERILSDRIALQHLPADIERRSDESTHRLKPQIARQQLLASS